MASVEDICARAKAAVMAYKVPDAKAVATEAVNTEGVDLVRVIQEGFSAGITEVGKIFFASKSFPIFSTSEGTFLSEPSSRHARTTTPLHVEPRPS